MRVRENVETSKRPSLQQFDEQMKATPRVCQNRELGGMFEVNPWVVVILYNRRTNSKPMMVPFNPLITLSRLL